jgi:hypothetical protein
MIFTTDVSFMIIVMDNIRSTEDRITNDDSSSNNDKSNKVRTIHTEALHDITRSWSNKPSVYYYTLDEFRRRLLECIIKKRLQF